jgi:hypothetical protein
MPRLEPRSRLGERRQHERERLEQARLAAVVLAEEDRRRVEADAGRAYAAEALDEELAQRH